ncbi:MULTISPECIES: hypothetical protein [unclassified Siphonobacter]|uniref:hypothetical protein n=1 Tax=unclassified Siphonobacter TaxID=2635712 RepID=UPI00277E97FE|nr:MULTISPECIES: hypothetical protein [unclassified Siphonobacter]MDQ1089935.1 putative membrane protein YkvI [Siphonobacter sp. SORGH_AS_1065]MDR6197743.1 putative membrane protein YkvI [Siphonobacter sp. SORGH_AS_0500]
MNLSKIFSIVTPLTLASLIGLMMIGTGIVNTGRENNILQYFFGIPFLIGPLVLHFLIRVVCSKNNITIWIVEGILVILSYLAFLRM